VATRTHLHQAGSSRAPGSRTQNAATRGRGSHPLGAESRRCWLGGQVGVGTGRHWNFVCLNVRRRRVVRPRGHRACLSCLRMGVKKLNRGEDEWSDIQVC
jgi:ribosomal protein L34E